MSRSLNSLNLYSKKSSSGSNLNIKEDLNDDRTSIVSNNTTVLSNNFDKINYTTKIACFQDFESKLSIYYFIYFL